MKFQNLTNKKYGMLTAIRRVRLKKEGTYWELVCQCGTKVIRLAGNIKKHHMHSCGCIAKNSGKKNAGFHRLFNDYKASARLRKYSFSLSKKNFKALINENCYYCNAAPSLRYKKQIVHQFFANGIDRLDNKKGYTRTNVVSCCKTCNVAKNNLSAKEFFSWIERVYLHRQLIKTNEDI